MQIVPVGKSLIVTGDEYHHWIAAVEKPRLSKLVFDAQNILKHKPLISVLMPVHNTEEAFLREAVDSVLIQKYSNWQLCIVDDASTAPHILPILSAYAKQDKRITVKINKKNVGIAATTNAAFKMARGKYIALMDHDDMLASHALLLVAATIIRHPGVKVIYTDSDHLDEHGRRVEPYFKTEWNYDLLLGQNYLNHLTIYDASRIKKIGGLRSEHDGSQDYDLALRATSGMTQKDVVHIPEILYHWRKVDTSVSRTRLAAAARAARSAVADHLKHRGFFAKVKPNPKALIYNQILWPALKDAASVIVYGQNRDLIQITTQEVRKLAGSMPLQFNYVLLVGSLADLELLNGAAIQQTSGVVLYIAAGLQPMSEVCLEQLLGLMGRDEIGAASGRLVTSGDRPIGPLLFTGDDGEIDPIYNAAPRSDNVGYFSRMVLTQQVSAIQSGCIAVDAKLLRLVGGWKLTPMNGGIAGIELSLRLREEGARLVWSADSCFKSRDPLLDKQLETAGTEDIHALLQQHADMLASEPLANKNLSQHWNKISG